MHKKDQGKLGEALVIAECLRQSVEVFVDFGDNSRVDLILNTNEGLIKVQVKCLSRDSKDPSSISLNLYKNGPGYSYRYTSTDIDYFAVVDLKTSRIAWLKVTDDLCNKYQLKFRLDDHRWPGKRNTFEELEQFPFLSINNTGP